MTYCPIMEVNERNDVAQVTGIFHDASRYVDIIFDFSHGVRAVLIKVYVQEFFNKTLSPVRYT